MTRKATAEESKEVATIVSAITTAPTFIQEAGDIGNEGVGAEDLVIPRLMLLQDLSPEVKKTHKKYVSGAESGKIINTLTKEFVDSVRVINLHQNREFPIFKKRDHGGGYRGIAATKEEAYEFIRNAQDGSTLDIVETVNHFCLTLDDNNKPIGEVIIPMTSTKISFSRQWNSMIKLRQGARFGTIWTLGTALQSNTTGQEYYNYAITAPGEWVTDEALFKIAQQKHDVVKKMVSVTNRPASEDDED